ncbi:MAG: class A beta-lactamase-related serine hydrolase [Balneola sp.]|nr:MAG: class A beta-lactamase-related serine hydrolase [Balneola sp.]
MYCFFFLILSNTLFAQDLEIDQLVNDQIDNHSIPGIAVGVVKDGNVILSKGYGYSDVENKTKANEHTIYQIGSVTKMFTGHLLSILIEKQILSPSDTLSDFFPDDLNFPKSPSGQVVTIKDIATHSSEFPRYPSNLERIDPDPIQGYSIEQMLEGIELVSIKNKIGGHYSYSNFGYGILGIAMEYRMNKPLSELLDEHIFSAYHMNHSSLFFRESLHDNLATPYLEVSPLKKTEPWDMGTLAGAGNIFSSVSDLNQFMIHLLKESKTNDIQMKKRLSINETWSYGLGCFVIDSSKWDTQIIYHGGDIDGYASYLALYPEFDLGIVILTNWGEGQRVGEAFSEISDAVANHFLNPID